MGISDAGWGFHDGEWGSCRRRCRVRLLRLRRWRRRSLLGCFFIYLVDKREVMEDVVAGLRHVWKESQLAYSA